MNLGPVFPDMSHVYNPELCEVIRKAAKKLNVPFERGNLCSVLGAEL